MKKVYFACSIRGGRDRAGDYATIVNFLNGHSTLLTEVFADQKLTDKGMNKPNEVIHKTDMAWIDEANIIVAEVSIPSLGVGYEIAKAESLNKPVICLYKTQSGKKLSAMIAGSPNLELIEYSTLDDALKRLGKFL